jgi:hypothetical protein
MIYRKPSSMTAMVGATARVTIERGCAAVQRVRYAGAMRCIICLEDRSGTAEHVFPLAIGGSLVTDRVCRPCNSHLGDTADSYLTNHPLIEIERSAFRLAGNSGEVPDPLRKLMRRSTLKDDGQKVRVETAPDGTVDVRLLYHERESVTPKGDLIREVSIDARDRGDLRKIISRQRKRANLPPLSAAELQQEIEETVRQGTRTLGRPTIHARSDIDINLFRLGLLKIAYELGFLWFGEIFLGQPEAVEMRDVLLRRKNLDASTIEHSIQIGLAPPMMLWRRPAGWHIAYSMEVRGRVALALKIFNTFSATFICGDAARLPSGQFIALDVRAGTWRQTAFLKELHRVVHRLNRARLHLSTAMSGGAWPGTLQARNTRVSKRAI